MRIKKQHFVITFLTLIVAVGFGVYKYTYKPHRNIATEKVDFNITPIELVKLMSNDIDAMKLTDKVIKTSGKVTDIEKDAVILDDKIQVNLNADFINQTTTGEQITIKGRCVGYDDLLEIVKIDQASLINY